MSKITKLIINLLNTSQITKLSKVLNSAKVSEKKFVNKYFVNEGKTICIHFPFSSDFIFHAKNIFSFKQ